MTRRALGLAAASLIATAVLATAAAPSTLGRPDLLARTLANTAGGPVAVIALEDEAGRQLGAAGFPDVGQGAPMSASTRFRVADISEAFIAAGLLDASTDGLTSLQDRVEDWLVGRKLGGGELRVRHLLNHTSGLVRGLPRAPPGTQFTYDPANYRIAADLAEVTTGSTLAGALRDRVFEPLGLRQTSLSPGARVSGLAVGYVMVGKRLVRADRPPAPRDARARGVVSTPSDLVHFMRALVGGRLLDANQSRELLLSVAVRGFPAQRFGLGVFRVGTPCGSAWGHRGRATGHTSWAYALEDGSRAVAAAVNVGGLRGRRLTDSERVVRGALCHR